MRRNPFANFRGELKIRTILIFLFFVLIAVIASYYLFPFNAYTDQGVIK